MSPDRIVAIGGAGVTVIVVLAVAFNLVARPMYQYDSRAIWGQKAKIIHHERTIFSEAVEEKSAVHPHPRYPLLLPIGSAWVFDHMGEPDDRNVRIVFLTFFLALLVTVYGFQRGWFGTTRAILSVSAICIVPFSFNSMKAGASSGYADLPLTFYMAASACCAIQWMKERKCSHAVLTALLAACAALTKNEGMAFALILPLALSIVLIFPVHNPVIELPKNSNISVRLKTGGGMFHFYCLYFLIITALLVPWFCVRSKLPTFHEEEYLRHLTYANVASGLSRAPLIMKALMGEFVNFGDWGLVWILALVSLGGLRRKRTRESCFILLIIILQLSCYLFAYVITPDDPAIQLRDSLGRLLLHLVPLSILLVFQIIDTPGQAVPGTTEEGKAPT